MKVILMTIPGCPHSAPAREVFARALELEGIDPALLTVEEVATDVHAAAVAFHGSPSFVIDGTDLFPSNSAPSVSCRIYPHQGGFAAHPELETLRDAIRETAIRSRWA